MVLPSSPTRSFTGTLLLILPAPRRPANPSAGAASTDARAGSLAASARCLTFSLGGLSKEAGLPQVKVGWIRVGGPASLAEEALRRLEVVADTYLSVGTPAQWALPGLLAAGSAIGGEIRQRVRSNYAWLERLAMSASGASWQLLAAEGGWSAILRVPGILSEEEWCIRLVDADGILLHPGYFFDFEREAYLVTSLLPPEADFRAGLTRVIERINQVSSGDQRSGVGTR